MTKDRYIEHLNELTRVLSCVSDAHNKEDFLEDLKMLRMHNRKLKKLMKDKEIYPQAPPNTYNEREKEITKNVNVIIDICKERNISYNFYTINDFEFKKLDMVVRLVRRGSVLNVLLDLE